MRMQEGLDDLETLDELLALGFAGGLFHLDAQLGRERLDVEILEELTNRLRPHADLEVLFRVLVEQLQIMTASTCTR